MDRREEHERYVAELLAKLKCPTCGQDRFIVDGMLACWEFHSRLASCPKLVEKENQDRVVVQQPKRAQRRAMREACRVLKIIRGEDSNG